MSGLARLMLTPRVPHGREIALDLLAQATRRSDHELQFAQEWTRGTDAAKLIRIRKLSESGNSSKGGSW